MAALATREQAVAEQRQSGQGASRLFEPGGATLEDVVLLVWEDLTAEGRAVCPVCGGSMSPSADGGCPACGSELS
jgi:tRNA(Ile2) C34 agmatinyltransferase TiaS